MFLLVELDKLAENSSPFAKKILRTELRLTKKNEEQEKCNSMDENCYLKNIYYPNIPLHAKFSKEQTNENWNLTLIKVSVFYFLNENYFE